jgi:hypothetical protein
VRIRPSEGKEKQKFTEIVYSSRLSWLDQSLAGVRQTERSLYIGGSSPYGQWNPTAANFCLELRIANHIEILWCLGPLRPMIDLS